MVRHLIALLAFALPLAAAEPSGTSLFDGTTFTGWEGNTTAIWRIEDGALVAGRMGLKQPENDFLCTTREYGDFDLTLMYCNKRMNGGVQFRSQRVPKSHEMIGYQADFLKGGDGNLYDESRRRRNLAVPDAATVAKLALVEWNRLRIRAVGPHISLWVNGVQTVDYTEADPAIPQRGFIGLQIHKNAQEIRYRDLVITELPPGAAP